MRINNKRQSKTPDINVFEDPPLQGAEFKHVRVLLPSEGRKEADTHRRIGAAVHQPVVMKKELNHKAKLWISWSYLPALTCGHELWVMTEGTRSRIQAANMSSLHEVLP